MQRVACSMQCVSMQRAARGVHHATCSVAWNMQRWHAVMFFEDPDDLAEALQARIILHSSMPVLICIFLVRVCL
jgi:hypothetical protein